MDRFINSIFWAFTVLIVGLALLVLGAFHNTMIIYSGAVATSFVYALRVLLAFGVMYVGFRLYLSFEYHAIVNERFKFDNVEVLPPNIETDLKGDDFETKVITAYNNLIDSNSFSLNKLALAVFGKTGGKYNNQLKAVLQINGVNL